jgi:hypothetical protein
MGLFFVGLFAACNLSHMKRFPHQAHPRRGWVEQFVRWARESAKRSPIVRRGIVLIGEVVAPMVSEYIAIFEQTEQDKKRFRMRLSQLPHKCWRGHPFFRQSFNDRCLGAERAIRAADSTVTCNHAAYWVFKSGSESNVRSSTLDITPHQYGEVPRWSSASIDELHRYISHGASLLIDARHNRLATVQARHTDVGSQIRDRILMGYGIGFGRSTGLNVRCSHGVPCLLQASIQGAQLDARNHNVDRGGEGNYETERQFRFISWLKFTKPTQHQKFVAILLAVVAALASAATMFVGMGNMILGDSLYAQRLGLVAFVVGWVMVGVSLFVMFSFVFPESSPLFVFA